MTPDDIARMVADADGVPRFKPARLYAGYVRALAAELTIFKSALHDESRESDQWQLKCNALAAEVTKARRELLDLRDVVSASSLTVYDSIAIARGTRAQLENHVHLRQATENAMQRISEQRDEARTQLEAVTSERDRYKAALERIAWHADNGLRDIAREALKGAG